MPNPPAGTERGSVTALEGSTARPSTDGVKRYIDAKRAVLRNMGRIQDELTKLQLAYATGGLTGGRPAEIYFRIQSILDDPFAADGLPTST